MNVLIVGLGYAGTRFYQAFSNLNKNDINHEKINIAYVDTCPKRSDIQYFEELDTAIKVFDPAIIVISVNDDAHADIIEKLDGYKGFVICEKPLTNTQADLKMMGAKLSDTSGFCLDMVTRYSDATIALKEYVKKNDLRLIRGNFSWAKDRINDHRPTCGVISEIIHPLDIIQWICAPDSHLELKDIQGTRSDFSISGSEVLDSAAVTAYLAGAVVTGYSSFVNIMRKREVDLVFASPDNKLIFATLVFDTPVWDIDCLRIWEKTSSGEHIIMDIKTEFDDSNSELQTIRKLIRLVNDVVGYVLSGKTPSQPFSNLQTALTLQKLLNRVESDARTIGSIKYVVGPNREFFNDESNWERLG